MHVHIDNVLFTVLIIWGFWGEMGDGYSSNRTTVTDAPAFVMSDIFKRRKWGAVCCRKCQDWVWCIWYIRFLSSKVNETWRTFGLFYLKILRSLQRHPDSPRPINPLSSNAPHWNDITGICFQQQILCYVLQGDKVNVITNVPTASL